MAKVMIGVDPYKLSAPSRSSTSPNGAGNPHARHERASYAAMRRHVTSFPGAGGRSGAAPAGPPAGAAAAGRRRACRRRSCLDGCLSAEANPLLRIAGSPFHCRGAGRAKWRVQGAREGSPHLALIQWPYGRALSEASETVGAWLNLTRLLPTLTPP